MIDSVQRDTSEHILPHSGLEIYQRQNQLVCGCQYESSGLCNILKKEKCVIE